MSCLQPSRASERGPLMVLFGDIAVHTWLHLGGFPATSLRRFPLRGWDFGRSPRLYSMNCKASINYRLPIHDSRRARRLPPEFPYDCKRVVLFAYLAEVLAQDLELVLDVFDLVGLLAIIVLRHEAKELIASVLVGPLGQGHIVREQQEHLAKLGHSSHGLVTSLPSHKG